MHAATAAAKAVAARFVPQEEDGDSRKELAHIESCRPFGVRRLIDSAILFASLRSFITSDKRLVQHVRGRPGKQTSGRHVGRVNADFYTAAGKH